MRYIIVSIFIFTLQMFLFEASGQSIDEIKKEQEKSEKEITYLNKLLKETQANQNASVERLKMIQQKRQESQRLVNSLNKELQYTETQITKNRHQINNLRENKESLVDLYSDLVYDLWKKKNRTHKLMFIFAARDFNQAYNRYRYFEQIQNYSKKQLGAIQRLNDSLYYKNNELEKLIDSKNKTLNEINVQNRELALQQQQENSLVTELQKKEKDIKRKIENERKNRQRLANELNKLIAAQNKKSGSGNSSSYKLTPEEKLVSDDFAKNKGRLPWPVAEGIVTEKYGRNKHPVYKMIELENDGINISSSKNANVRAVFDGVVSEILLMPGFNNMVIVRHGKYLSVYANLLEVGVKKGEKISTKQIIGKLAYDEAEGSILNFQIWNDTNKQNPETWLSK